MKMTYSASRAQGQKWGGGTMRRSVLSVLVMTAVSISLTQVAFAGGGNSGAAQTCQKGGYANLVRSDGSMFANAGACVSYAALDGAFVPVTLSATFVPDPSRGEFQNLTVTGSGLQPWSTVSYSFVQFANGIRTVSLPTEVNHTVASDGGFLTAWGTGCPLDHSFEFYATTAYGAPITASGC